MESLWDGLQPESCPTHRIKYDCHRCHSNQVEVFCIPRYKLWKYLFLTGFPNYQSFRSWNHEAVWKANHKTSNLAKYLLSAQMRGTETMMSDDHVAFTSAALLRAMTDWSQPNQSQASLMADLLDTIRFRRGVFLIQNCKKFLFLSPILVYD